MPKITPKKLGKLISYARTKKQLSKYAVAKATGISIGQIEYIEAGTKPVSTATLFPLLAELDIKVTFSFNQKTLKG